MQGSVVARKQRGHEVPQRNWVEGLGFRELLVTGYSPGADADTHRGRAGVSWKTYPKNEETERSLSLSTHLLNILSEVIPPSSLEMSSDCLIKDAKEKQHNIVKKLEQEKQLVN